jgi:2-haloalkanoic acid dehalogenase type II
VTKPLIEAVAFDCYGTLIDFGDEAFRRAYGQICAEQGIPIDGTRFYDKWMEIWRRLAGAGHSADGGSVGVIEAAVAVTPDRPAPLSEAEPIPPHPEHHTPSAGRSRSLDGPLPPYRPYREEWPEHFAMCFEELNVRGDAQRAHQRLVELLGTGKAFAEAHRVVETVRGRRRLALLSNADDDFLRPVLATNGLDFPVVVSSETARAYKPHMAIFLALTEALDLPPERILYVGDSRLADIVGAKNAGLQAAWINRHGAVNRSLKSKTGEDAEADSILARFPPDYEISSLDELLDVLQLRKGVRYL